MIVNYTYIISLLTFLAVASIFMFFIQKSKYSYLKTKMENESAGRIEILKKITSFIEKSGVPLNNDKIDKELTLADRPFNLTTDEFVGAYTILVVGSAVSTLALVQTGAITSLIAYLIIAIVVTVPYFHIRKQADIARVKLKSELIDLLYNMELGVSGGLSETRVIEWVAESGDGLLAPILKKMVKEVNLGGKEYLVFSRIGVEYNIPDAEEIGMVLKHANIHGVSIAESLYNLAKDFRYRREQELEKNIIKIKPSITLYVILTFLVASAIFLVGPIIAEYGQYLTFQQ